jgi:peroxiredoxin
MNKTKKLLGLLSFTFALSAFASVKIGQEAPNFTLTDTNGKSHSLADFKGKVVVLEWLNHDCPYVVKHYESKNMQKTQEEITSKGGIWLSINSSAPGQQGNFPAAKANELTNEKGGNATAVLIDESGEVGKKYGAKVTPHMYIIDAGGKLVYNGAIDSIKSTKVDDVPKATNYVLTAFNEISAGKKVAKSTSTPYGCSVKYK